MRNKKGRVKFTGKDKDQFFNTLRKRVDNYFTESRISKHANNVMIWKSIALLSAYILPFVAMMIWSIPFWICMLLWFVMGIALAGNGMSVMHDANHGAYSANDRINRLMGASLNLLGGSSFNWKLQHNILHHSYTNIDGMDEDIDSKVLLRFSPNAPLKKSHRFQVLNAIFFYGILTLYWGLLKDFVQLVSYTRSGVNTNTRAENARLFLGISFFKIIYFFVFVVMPIWLFDLPWQQVVAGFLLMHFTAGIILSVVFQLAHTVEGTVYPVPDSKGNIETAWAIHQLQTTVNFARNNKWLSWYVGGLNFQIEHHLFPGTCHVHYPAIAPIVKETAEEFGIPYMENNTFFAALKSHIRTLQKFGRPALNDIMN
jgi:linoleoyl-CoA desaturase